LSQNDTEVIDINDRNTITLTGHADAGLPIVDGATLVGYVAANELEHALKHVEELSDSTECQFRKDEHEVPIPNGQGRIITDFTAYTDQAPLTVSKNASLEVVLELFKKLGLRYVCVVNGGDYVGVIHKKQLLVYLRNLATKRPQI
ncbi:3867_t:CDS:2, partial [Dentiscutata heterogama]